jgi:hypothetical protein
VPRFSAVLPTIASRCGVTDIQEARHPHFRDGGTRLARGISCPIDELSVVASIAPHSPPGRIECDQTDSGMNLIEPAEK